MAPLVHCVRHAQGFHNVSIENLGIPDPVLTPFGEQQCASLAASFPLHSHISEVVASPLTRTLQTALLSFQPSLSNGRCDPTIIALPEAQETSDLVSDTGSDPEYLKQLCQRNDWAVDLSLVDVGWNVKESERWAPTREAISKRAREARMFLMGRVRALQQKGIDSPEIVFVTHGGFLHYFTEDWEDSGVDIAYKSGRENEITWDIPGTAWRNTEFRSYNIIPCVDELGSNPQLLETVESRTRRGKSGLSETRRQEISAIQSVMAAAQLNEITAPCQLHDRLTNSLVEDGTCRG